jgi:hypothetical protein
MQKAKIGTTISEQTRAKLSRSLIKVGKGLPKSEITKNKMRLRILGNNNNKANFIEMKDLKKA